MTNSIAQKFNVFSLLKFAFPTMVMMVFMSLYTIVDGIFVSRLVGSNALSAVNIVYPVINLMFACGIMLSTGGSAIVARQIGEKKESEARENFSLIALVSFLVGVVILAVGILFLEPLCNVLGATPLILSDCKRYLGVLLLFGPLTMMQMFFRYFCDCGKADTRIGFNDYRRSYQCHFRLSVYGTYGNGRDWSGSCNRNWTDDHGGCWNCVLFRDQKGALFCTTGISQNSIAGKLWKWLFGDGEQSFNGDCDLFILT